MSDKFRIAVCTLNQLALQFDGNLNRIVKSIQLAKEKGAILRVGPELEVCGYSCEDAYFEPDTEVHSWQVLNSIIAREDLDDIIIDIGMPVRKDSVLYGCRVILYNRKIVLIRPKTKLAGNGNYRENRWFSEWQSDDSCYFKLPSEVAEVSGQKFVPFGSDVVIEVTRGKGHPLRIGFEICEELWRPDASHVKLFLERGCHLICNSSASYWEIRKLDRAFILMQSATLKSGGCYAFSNLIGCDGGRLCFYGRSHITLNGNLLDRTSGPDDFLEEVQLAMADIDVLEIEGYRSQNYIRSAPHLATGSNINFNAGSYGNEFNDNSPLTKLTIHLELESNGLSKFASLTCNPSLNIKLKPEEELALYGSLWMWDYLRRCKGMGGFIIPLSGGIDSSSVACLVYKMCQMVFDRINRIQCVQFNPNDTVCQLLGVDDFDSFTQKYQSVNQLCRKVLRCVYLGTKYSGEASKSRAEKLSQLLGAEFIALNFNNVYETILATAVDGGHNDINSNQVSLKEQNLQARLRMVHTYFLAENRLVLSTGNVDEALVGYLTKYDCSAGDLNPIGSISKQDLRQFMRFFEQHSMQRVTVVTEIIDATPSAELTGEDQSDEADLGLTYEELSLFGRYRRGVFGSFGPYLTFCRMWTERDSHHLKDPNLLATKVKRFFSLHARNRHKQTVLTPSLHAESYSPDDNRFDHRQFLFDTTWSWQFSQIDEKLRQILLQG